MMTDNHLNTTSEETQQQLNTTTDASFQYEEYGELEQSFAPAFEFSSPISSISSNCSSPDRTAMPDNQPYRSCHIDDDDFEDDGDDDFVSLEELKSQISPPSDDDCSSAKTLTRHSQLETIFEDVYLETPPGTPTTGSSDMLKSRKRRMATRLDLSKCEEFKENVQSDNV